MATENESKEHTIWGRHLGAYTFVTVCTNCNITAVSHSEATAMKLQRRKHSKPVTLRLEIKT